MIGFTRLERRKTVWEFPLTSNTIFALRKAGIFQSSRPLKIRPARPCVLTFTAAAA